MKVKNVKRGVRVELKSSDSSNGLLKTGHLGTILEFADNDMDLVRVQWDDFTDGHSHGNPTIENSSWCVWVTEIKKVK